MKTTSKRMVILLGVAALGGLAFNCSARIPGAGTAVGGQGTTVTPSAPAQTRPGTTVGSGAVNNNASGTIVAPTPAVPPFGATSAGLTTFPGQINVPGTTAPGLPGVAIASNTPVGSVLPPTGRITGSDGRQYFLAADGQFYFQGADGRFYTFQQAAARGIAPAPMGGVTNNGATMPIGTVAANTTASGAPAPVRADARAFYRGTDGLFYFQGTDGRFYSFAANNSAASGALSGTATTNATLVATPATATMGPTPGVTPITGSDGRLYYPGTNGMYFFKGANGQFYTYANPAAAAAGTAVGASGTNAAAIGTSPVAPGTPPVFGLGGRKYYLGTDGLYYTQAPDGSYILVGRAIPQ